MEFEVSQVGQRALITLFGLLSHYVWVEIHHKGLQSQQILGLNSKTP
jgi:hypothetical protein